ncbi:hypothetical protein KY084_15740 [Stakelama sp. CBK3Z-3]|uniref:Uncharacterized protein n=1 Tax=Stakelama flava TaxID=2860338 RepID=A0ABS6XPT3_9SPHN|nr:hypothetical protein [Stakelama flava]MBW4332260.1 hypothetical protein [Stakelama flava]MBW4332309.1 hypothetical protein [Stakelama flava]
MSCKGHGHRDSNYPRWICGICDPAILAAAAVIQSGGPSIQNAVTALVSSAVLREAARYRTLEEFVEANPEYAWLLDAVNAFLEEAPRRFNTDDTEPFWYRLTPEGKRLIAAAVILAETLKLDPDDLIELLRVLVITWRQMQG